MVSNNLCKVHHSLSFLTDSAIKAQTAQLFVRSGDFKLPAAVANLLSNKDRYKSISSEGAQRGQSPLSQFSACGTLSEEE
jgi:hypothetical protein